MFTKTTRDITVTVEPTYLELQSDPDAQKFVWAYHIRIENRGDTRVTLQTRRWQVTDAFGRAQTVQGVGVVGQQPVLEPGDHFEYTSGTPLDTPSGIMVGSYTMQNAAGDMFEVAVPAFSLDCPHERKTLH
ncbi:MAG: Co2+/Mg2+ efflux protein ApaG [Bdellovibrionales bacterium]